MNFVYVQRTYNPVLVLNHPLQLTFNIFLIHPQNCDYVIECGFLFDMTISHFIRFIMECLCYSY